MQAVQQRDTSCELALRRELFANGLRYRVNARPLPQRRITADVLVKKYKLAVFVDGCFWHGCPLHGTTPVANEQFWTRKLAGNKKRDEEQTQLLPALGWKVFRFWEHEQPAAAAKKVLAYISSKRRQLSRRNALQSG